MLRETLDLEELPAIATPAQVAAVIQSTTAALAQDRHRRRGLPYVKFGGRVRYLRDDVLTYIRANRTTAA